MMQKGGHKWWILAGVGGVVVLAVIIVVVTVMARPSEEVAANLSDSEQISILEETLNEVASMNESRVEAYLDAQIEKYTGMNLEYNMRMMKANYLQEAGDTRGALEAAEKVNVDILSLKEKMEYYMQMSILYYDLGDKVKGAEYNEMYRRLHVEIYGEMEGGR